VARDPPPLVPSSPRDPPHTPLNLPTLRTQHNVVVHPLLAPPAPHRRQRIGWLLLACAAAGLIWAGVTLAQDYRFWVRAVVVENVTAHAHGIDPLGFQPHCTAAELRHLADVRRDRPIWKVDLPGIVEGVMQHPWVASVEASKRWPDTVVIRVTEHRPVLLLQQAGLFYVNDQAEVFKRARGSDLDYPVLTGLDPELVQHSPAVARRVVSDAIQVLAQIADSSELDADDLSEIRFHDQDGFTLVLRGGTELALGFAQPAERLGRLEQLRASGLDTTEPRRIDLAPSTVALVSPLSKRTSPGLD